MKNSIRWLLTEARLSNIDTNKINFIDGKLICYHLTSKKKWLDYNLFVRVMDSPETGPDKEILSTDSKAQRIVKNITNLAKNKRPEEWEIEQTVIEDMIYDPYTDTSGFNPGGGAHHGPGLYSCYKFNPSIAWLYGEICLAFEIDISNFLITFEDLAKKVHGENWRIRDQLLKLYTRDERSAESIEKFKKFLSDIPDEEIKMEKSIKGDGRTAETSQNLLHRVAKVHVTSLYDGIILFGRGDGPVCVSFYPKYDAKLIGLGRVNKERPEIVDWYDSLDDFLGGRARLKQDFETINAIAEETSNPEEREKMKSADRQPFDMDYLEITSFFRGLHNKNINITNPEETASRFFSLYEDAKASNDDKMLEYFFESFEKSAAVSYNNIPTMSSTKYKEVVEELVKLYKVKNKYLNTFYFCQVIDVCNETNITLSDFFLKSAIESGYNQEAIEKEQYNVRHLKKSLEKYLSNNPLSQELQSALDEKIYEVGADLIVMSQSADELLGFYSKVDETVKNKAVNKLLDNLPRAKNLYWKDLSSQNFKAANELLEKLIDEINKTKSSSSYEFHFIRLLFDDMPYIDYLSNKVNEFIAIYFLNSYEEVMTFSNPNLFINTTKYIQSKLDKSDPKLLKISQIIDQEMESIGSNIESFVNDLSMGKITNSQLKIIFKRLQEDMPYMIYLSRQSKSWFSNFCKAVIKNIKNFKSLGKAEAGFLLAMIISHDIVLTKEEQLTFTGKFAKTDYDSKNLIADYRHIDPDVFIKLIGPDLQKGGMGPGLTFKGFEHSSNIYRLLYNHRKIVDLFCDVARPGLMKMIIGNLNDELMGQSNPRYTWGQSGFLIGPTLKYTYSNLPYMHNNIEKIKISEAVSMDDIAWFEYFISKAKTSPQRRGAYSALKALEKSLNDKKSKMQSSTSTQAIDDLDPQLDLSHRKIVGNTLKEVYNIVIKRKRF